MSLVQPTRPPQGNGNNVGVKRPYQLMINNAAYNSGSDGNYPGRLKNVKLEKEALMEELIEDNLVIVTKYFLYKNISGSNFVTYSPITFYVFT